MTSTAAQPVRTSQPAAQSLATPLRGAALLAAGLGTAALILCPVTANAATPAATPSTQDQAFFTSNAQSNLAEITLGNLGLSKGQDAATKALAQVTLDDHTKLEAQLASIAQADGVTLPTAPNAMQMATAAQLTATSTAAFDLAYAQAETAGHQLAIAAANTEVSSGSDPALISYATAYVPIATMHLTMAQAEVSALSTATPTAVSAGSGGRATTDTADRAPWVAGIIGGLTVTAGSVLVLRRRRPATA